MLHDMKLLCTHSRTKREAVPSVLFDTLGSRDSFESLLFSFFISVYNVDFHYAW